MKDFVIESVNVHGAQYVSIWFIVVKMNIIALTSLHQRFALGGAEVVDYRPGDPKVNSGGG